jgi:hypothetical protein
MALLCENITVERMLLPSDKIPQSCHVQDMGVLDRHGYPGANDQASFFSSSAQILFAQV